MECRLECKFSWFISLIPTGVCKYVDLNILNGSQNGEKVWFNTLGMQIQMSGFIHRLAIDFAHGLGH